MGGESVVVESETRMWLSKKFKNDLIGIWCKVVSNIRIQNWYDFSTMVIHQKLYMKIKLLYLQDTICFERMRADMFAEEAMSNIYLVARNAQLF